MVHKIGDVVRIDTDNEEWGRVTGEGMIIGKTRNGYLISAHSIRAHIIVSKDEVFKKR